MRPDPLKDVFVATGFFAEHHMKFFDLIDQNYPHWERRFKERLLAKGVKPDEIITVSRWTRSGREVKLVKARGHVWTYFPLKKNKTLWVTGPKSAIQQMDMLPKREV